MIDARAESDSAMNEIASFAFLTATDAIRDFTRRDSAIASAAASSEAVTILVPEERRWKLCDNEVLFDSRSRWPRSAAMFACIEIVTVILAYYEYTRIRER